MAIDAYSTPAPSRPLLPFVFRSVPPVHDPRSAVELLDEILSIIEGQEGSVPQNDTPEFYGLVVKPEPPPEPLLPAADRAHTLHLRRQLAEAAEHGAALLNALGLPRLVTADFEPIDREVIADALDLAIATLDAVDGDTNIEEGGDDEPSLGWVDGRPQFCGEYQDREHDTADCEPSLASPERHPTLPWEGSHARHYVTRGPQDRQTRWADGGQQDS